MIREGSGIQEYINKTEEEDDEESENNIQKAALQVGLEFNAPKIGTVAYKRIKMAAENYMNAVHLARQSSVSYSAGLNYDAENYRHTSVKVNKPIGASNMYRDKAHDELCRLLFGKGKQEISLKMKKTASNFAAYLMNEMEEYNKF